MGGCCEPHELRGISCRAEELLSKKGLCSILCPLLLKFDILCATYFEIRFYSFAPLVRSRIIRDALYENCILIYRTRILVVLTPEMWAYWTQYFGYTAGLRHFWAQCKKEVFGPCLHVVLNWQCISSKDKNLHTKCQGDDKSLARPERKQARKHVSGAGDFSNIETRTVIKSSQQGEAPKEIHAILTETLACFLPGRAKDLSTPLYVWQNLEYSQPFRGPPNGRGPIQPYMCDTPTFQTPRLTWITFKESLCIAQ